MRHHGHKHQYSISRENESTTKPNSHPTIFSTDIVFLHTWQNTLTFPATKYRIPHSQMDQGRPNCKLGRLVQNSDLVIGQLPGSIAAMSEIGPHGSHVVVHHTSASREEEQVGGREAVANLVQVLSRARGMNDRLTSTTRRDTSTRSHSQRRRQRR